MDNIFRYIPLWRLLLDDKDKKGDEENMALDWTPEQTKTNQQAGQSYSSTDYMQTLGNYGWICPICKRVLSPWTIECPCGGQGMQTWTTTSTTETLTIDYSNKAKHMKGEE